MVHIGGQHLNSVFCSIAHDLRRCIKAHRLRVEQRAGERRWEVTLEPARDIDEMREARRMAFGKAIFAEAPYLVETALRELSIIATLHHAFDHQVLQFVHHAAAAESRHGLA